MGPKSQLQPQTPLLTSAFARLWPPCSGLAQMLPARLCARASAWAWEEAAPPAWEEAIAEACACAEPPDAELLAVELAHALPLPLEEAWALAWAEALEPPPPRSLRWSAAAGGGGKGRRHGGGSSVGGAWDNVPRQASASVTPLRACLSGPVKAAATAEM